MLDKIKDILSLERRFYVVGISNDEAGTSYSLLTVELKGEELKIEDRHASNTMDDGFLNKLAKNCPVLLYVEGDNLINKIVDNKVGYRNNLIFKANPDDFYFYEYHQGDKVYASVCRKTNIDLHVKAIEDLNLFVFHIAFGPFAMANLLPLVKDFSEIQSKRYALELSEGQVIDFKEKKASNGSYTINGDTFLEVEIPLLATFFSYKYPSEIVNGDTLDFSASKSEFKFKKWFRVAGIFALVFMMLSLFASHFLNDHYQEQLTRKEESYIRSQAKTAEIDRLREEVALKERILMENRMNNKNFITKYISEISNSVPNDITLKTISVFPETKKIRPKEKINFQSNTIIVEGEALRDDAFNEWVKQLKSHEWITAFEITEYNQSDKRTNTFKIETKI